MDWPTSTVLSFWCISLNTAFLHVHRPIFSLTIGRSLCLAGPLSETNSFWPSADPVDHPFSLSNRPIVLFFHRLRFLTFLTYFSKKRCQHMPSSFGVNDPFAPKFAWYLSNNSRISSRDWPDQSPLIMSCPFYLTFLRVVHHVTLWLFRSPSL
jgi:hypothetical protein